VTATDQRWAKFDRLAAKFLPLFSEAVSAHTRLGARFVLLTNLITSLQSMVLLALYGATGLWVSFAGVVVYFSFSLATPVLQRLGVPMRWLFWTTFVLVLLAVGTAALSERPLTSGVVAWAMIIPVTAFHFQGLRSGAVWTAITFASMALVVWLMPMNLLPTYEVPMPHVFLGVRLAMVLVALLGFSISSEINSRQLLAASQVANQAKSSFLANISHEIRTPLNGVLGMTEVMLLDEVHPARVEQLQVVQRSGRLLMALINELLDVTRAEKGELVLEDATFDLKRVLREVHELYAPQAQLRGVELRLELPEAVPAAVGGDDFRLRQMLGNLIGNALKFTARGSITVRLAHLAGERWTLEVEDTGIGISAAAMEGLFTAFKQADADTARRFGGTGLGLALVRLLATRMGGEVRLRSTVGVGSVFTLELPFPERSAVAVRPTPPVRAVMQTGCEVLVVDDNPVNLKIAVALFTRAGFLVTQATNGAEAVELATHHPFRVIYMDCQMPVLDGWAATRQLRAHAATALVPIVAFTASAMPEEVAACLEAGMNDVLTKPVSYETIRASLALQLG
jgi:signal transduction histidine kinase/CheY-like chemotaxis protein